MMYATLKRTYHPDVTLGELSLYYNAEDVGNAPIMSCKTVELPWLDNRSRISCIPEGVYRCKPRMSPKHGEHFHLQKVPGRSLILFHVANFTRQLEGCIAVGLSHYDLDGDGIMDVANSRIAMDALLRHGGYERDGFLVHITNKINIDHV